jgi:tetratricopeptide (TPR) repeat protein
LEKKQKEVTGVCGNNYLKCGYDNCDICPIGLKTDGDYALSNGEYSTAINKYKKALQAKPDFAEAWNNLASTYGLMGEYKNSLICCEKALSIDPTYEKALYSKAITLKNLGEISHARKTIESLLNSNPNNHHFAAFLEEINQKEEVIKSQNIQIGDAFQKSDAVNKINGQTLSEEQKDADVQYRMGLRYLDATHGTSKNFKVAVSLFLKAAEQGHGDAQNELGYCYDN